MSQAAPTAPDSRFPSRVDRWIAALLLIAIAGLFVALVAVLAGSATASSKAVATLLTLSGASLILSVLFRTHYTISGDILRIVSGRFAWTINIPDITEIEASRNPLSSPALSLDRLKITYKPNRCVLVSPADKDGFVNEIERRR